MTPPPDPLAAWLPRQRADLFAACAVAAVGFLAFANSLGNGLVFDDVSIIAENPAIRHLSDLRAIFAAGYWPDAKVDLLYRPLVIFSYALNYAVAGLAPFPYHLVNVLLHAGNSALVYRLVGALFRTRGLALVTAAAFALHPIHTEAVANVVGRAELLANVFLFLSWLWYLRWEEAPARARPRWLAASLVAFGLALFAKEHAVVLLGLLVLTDLLRAFERGLPPGRALWENARRAYAWYLLPLGGYLLARLSVLGVLLGGQAWFLANPIAHSGAWARMMTAIKVLGKYLWLLLVPVRLSADYSYNQIPVSRSLLEPGVLAGLLGLLGAGALAVYAWRRRPAIMVGISIFAITILPVSNFPFPIGTMMAERVLYLPSLGFCLLLAVAVTTLAVRPRWRGLAIGAFALLLLGYGTRTVLRNWDWRSGVVLFAAAARTSPESAVAQFNLGTSLLLKGDLSGARRSIEKSLQIYPNYGDAHTNLGVIFEEEGKFDEAIRAYQTAIRVDPKYAPAHLNLGFVYLRQGMRSEALEEFRQAASGGAFRVSDFNHLAKGFFLVGSLAEAQESLEIARYYSPEVFIFRNNLGLVYLRRGRWDEAQRELEAAARLKPDSPEVHMNLGRVYAVRGLPAQAEAAFKASLELHPGNPDALTFLGALLAQQGRLAEAEERLQAAIRLRPQFPAGHRALGEVLEQRGRKVEARRELRLAEEQERLLRVGSPGGSGR